MMLDEERQNSDIYVTPEDRKPHDTSVEFADSLIEEQPSLLSEDRKVKLSSEKKVKSKDLELSKKKKNFIIFTILTLVDVALFIYIIYLVVSIFTDIA